MQNTQCLAVASETFGFWIREESATVRLVGSPVTNCVELRLVQLVLDSVVPM